MKLLLKLAWMFYAGTKQCNFNSQEVTLVTEVWSTGIWNTYIKISILVQRTSEGVANIVYNSF